MVFNHRTLSGIDKSALESKFEGNRISPVSTCSPNFKLRKCMMHHFSSKNLKNVQDNPSGVDSIGSRLTAALLFLSIAFGLGLLAPANASNILDKLDQSQQAVIDLSCTSRHFAQGPDAYRDCLLQEFALIEGGIENDSEKLDDLSFDEQYAIQRACAAEYGKSSVAYTTCTRQQLDELVLEPEPQLSAISIDEQYALSQQCFSTQSDAGVRLYRKCINTALETLKTLPLADFSERTDVQRDNIQLECSISTGDINAYRKCLLKATGIAVEQVDESVSAALTTDGTSEPDTKTKPVPNSSDPVTDLPASALDKNVQTDQRQTLEAGVSDIVAIKPDTTADITAQAFADNAGADNNGDQIAAELTAADSLHTMGQRAPTSSDLLTRVQTGVAALSPTHWVALLAALSMPLMFFIIKPAQQKTVVSTAVPERHSTDNHHRRRKRERSNRVSNKRSNISTYVPPRAPDTAADTANRDNSLDITLDETLEDECLYLDQTFTVELPALHDQRTLTGNQSTNRAASIDAEFEAIDNLRLINWLENFEASQQQEYAIEYLIYWVAYADNRFDPALKQRVLRMKNPDAQNLIKRWVFNKDANAFADAISFLQSQTNARQRQQILDLLMALLVTEMALTPAQNNLLRFLSDAFGIGNAGLNEQYNRAYGQLMPPIPRPDKIMWWEQLSAEQKLRWDARSIARQPDNIRYRIALGQPLQGEVVVSNVEKSFKLAIDRCDPKRVNLLGNREACLITTQGKKFVIARDSLLEPIT